MAHFAELDENNVVLRVILFEGEGVDGEAACSDFMGGGTWKQTSYNGTIRGVYAGIGYTYDPAQDVFVPPTPVDLPRDFAADVPATGT